MQLMYKNLDHGVIQMIIILILIFIIINLSIVIHVELLKNNKNDEIVIKLITLFGLIKVKKEYPLIDFKLEKNISIEVSEETEGNYKEGLINEKNKEIDLDEILNKITASMDNFIKYKKVGKYVSNKISWEYLFWETEIGFDDAGTTGLIMGLINVLKTNIFVYINNHEINFNNISINTIPNFNSKIIKTTLNCIFRIKIVHIIIAGLKFARIRFINT